MWGVALAARSARSRGAAPHVTPVAPRPRYGYGYPPTAYRARRVCVINEPRRREPERRPGPTRALPGAGLSAGPRSGRCTEYSPPVCRESVGTGAGHTQTHPQDSVRAAPCRCAPPPPSPSCPSPSPMATPCHRSERASCRGSYSATAGAGHACALLAALPFEIATAIAPCCGLSKPARSPHPPSMQAPACEPHVLACTAQAWFSLAVGAGVTNAFGGNLAGGPLRGLLTACCSLGVSAPSGAADLRAGAVPFLGPLE